MNEKKKLKITLIIVAIFALIAVLVLFLNKNEGTNENELIKLSYDNFKEINRDSEIFTIQNIINDYYLKISKKKSSEIIDSLNSKFVQNNDINVENVIEKLNSNYQDISFYINEVYGFNQNNYSYYIINGFLFNYIISTEEIIYEKDIVYFIILNKNENTYSIYPLKGINYWETFVNNYESKNEILKSKYKSYNVSEENKIKMYINIFLNFLYLDNERAYSMLDKNTREYFGSKENFKANVDVIYNRISPTIFSYSKEEKNDQIVYKIKDNNQNNITITESMIMKYTISLNF